MIAIDLKTDATLWENLLMADVVASPFRPMEKR